MDKNYDHRKYEANIYQLWEKSGAFKAAKTGKPYTILMPPPNANASLHAGHAMYTIDDILVRFKRMQGYSAVWIPGMDHAGIETQYVYEKELAKKGQSRLDFDRQTLYQNIYDFVQKNSGLIYDQFRKLGFSSDWDRSVFTLDKEVLDRVFETFKKMESEGKVYRDEYIVNYCPYCGTSLAELEVEHKERTDNLYYIKYQLVSSDKFIEVATTRPEPIWVDTHLAVNLKDKKNKHLIGQQALNPLTKAGMEIVGDEFVDPKFGTGIVKLTPAHDPNDFEVARRHKLPVTSAFDLQGRLLPAAGKYAGLTAKAARDLIVTDLQKSGHLSKVDSHYLHSVAVCYRCGRDLEPMTVPNWFIKVDELKRPVVAAVKKDRVRFFPKRFKKHMLDWLEIMHDWPISRQIAWGIRIPAWYNVEKNPDLAVTFLDEAGTVQTGQIQPLLTKFSFSQIEAGLQTLIAPKTAGFIVSQVKPGDLYLQETDTFDTWFSSGQWPLVTLAESEMKDRLPTDVMGTLADILKFWVSRMIIFSLYLEGKVPFKDVYLWSMVADAKGVKMSKSKGNVVNPIELVDKYGADALRMTLVYGVAPGSKIPLAENKVKGMRNFANKIWNLGRFVESVPLSPGGKKNSDDKQIETELNQLIKRVTADLDQYQFGLAAEALYEFIWHKLADIYVEKIKDRKNEASSTLYLVWQTCLKLIHPFMPFVTEAVWQELKLDKRPLIVQDWPGAQTPAHGSRPASSQRGLGGPKTVSK